MEILLHTGLAISGTWPSVDHGRHRGPRNSPAMSIPRASRNPTPLPPIRIIPPRKQVAAFKNKQSSHLGASDVMANCAKTNSHAQNHSHANHSHASSSHATGSSGVITSSRVSLTLSLSSPRVSFLTLSWAVRAFSTIAGRMAQPKQIMKAYDASLLCELIMRTYCKAWAISAWARIIARLVTA